VVFSFGKPVPPRIEYEAGFPEKCSMQEMPLREENRAFAGLNEMNLLRGRG